MAWFADLLLILVALAGLILVVKQFVTPRPPSGSLARESPRTLPGVLMMSLLRLLLPDAVQAQTPALPSEGSTSSPTSSVQVKAGTHPDWKIIQLAIDFMKPLADTGKSTNRQRQQASQHLNDAETALNRLHTAGTLNAEEVQLMLIELDTLKGGVYANPPTDSHVTCYDMQYIPPGQVSLRQLRQKLPLLRGIVRRGSISREVLTRTLTTIEREFDLVKQEPRNPENATEIQSLTAELETLIQELKKLQ